MKIRTLRGNSRTLEFPPINNIGANRVDVITGPNGSGKTQILDAIVQEFAKTSPKRGRTSGWELEWENIPPTTVITQTFSPFTRFPATKKSVHSIFDIYLKEDQISEPYLCVGLHAGLRNLGGNISAKLLEEALYRLSIAPESLEVLLFTLKEMGYEESVDLYYFPIPGARELLSSTDNLSVEADLRSLLRDTRYQSPAFFRLRQELSEKNIDFFASELSNIIYIVNTMKRGEAEFVLSINGSTARQEFYQLQAFSLLRRLGLLTMKRCLLTSRRTGESIEISSSSSGQQQMLCTMFGLASALRRNSLVLIDEPELSLHPKRQSQIVDMIVNTLSATEGCHVLIATHSPLVVQRAQALGAGIVQLGDGEEIGDTVATLTEVEASVEETLINVFDTPTPHSPHIANEIFNAIVEGETGGETARAASLARLEQYRHIFALKGADKETVTNIDRAIRILKMPNQA